MSANRSGIPVCTPAISDELVPTLVAVQTNCHITDARHATDYTLCVYLLKMREYYRWENNLSFTSPLPHEKLTSWLTQREELWKTLEANAFGMIPVSDRHHDPFDAELINHDLTRRGYVYSSGMGRNLKPHFFLGALEKQHRHDIYTLYVSGREFARDLTAPPAMSLGNTIFIRRESLRRMLWEKIEEWRWNRPANAMQAAINCYDFDNEPESALEQMTDREIHPVMLHEIGEVMAGTELGSDWERMLLTMPHSKAEIMVRAVRDHLADTLSTLPGLLDDPHPAALHFYIANLTNMRKVLYPGLVSAYREWVHTGDTTGLRQQTVAGREHWLNLARDILGIHENMDGNALQEIVSLVESSVL